MRLFCFWRRKFYTASEATEQGNMLKRAGEKWKSIEYCKHCKNWHLSKKMACGWGNL